MTSFLSASQAASDAVQGLKSAASESILRLKDKESGKVGDEQSFCREDSPRRSTRSARALSDGQAAGPLAMPDGPHVLYMISNKRPRPRDFTAVRQQVLSDYRGEAIASLRIGDEQFLRKRANILLADDMRE